MRLDFSTGILTSFILPKGIKSDKRDPFYSGSYRGGSYYGFIRGLAFFMNITWILMVALIPLGIFDAGAFFKVTAITFVFEIIYKIGHHKYEYFS